MTRLQARWCYGVDAGELGGRGHFVSGALSEADLYQQFHVRTTLCGETVDGELSASVEQERMCPKCFGVVAANAIMDSRSKARAAEPHED